MNEAWDLHLSSEVGSEPLKLYAVLSTASEMLYLFCGRNLDGPFLEDRPYFMTELLIPLPMVPLKKTKGGFQMFSKSEWDSLLLEEEEVAPIFSNAQRSLFSHQEETEHLSDDVAPVSDQSFSNLSSEEEQSEITSEEETEEDDVSEGGLLEQEGPLEV
jgi:hypothetical protein